MLAKFSTSTIVFLLIIHFPFLALSSIHYPTAMHQCDLLSDEHLQSYNQIHHLTLNHVPISCDNIASPIFKILIFLGDGYSIGSLQWCSSESDSLPLCFGYFPTSYMKNNCMKNSLKKMGEFGGQNAHSTLN